MTHKPNTDDVLSLVTEVYASIVAPERFIEVLELWDRNIFDDPNTAQNNLSEVERRLAPAVPLLETSLRQVVNQDELVNRIIDHDRPSLLVATNRLVIASNAAGRRLFDLNDGDRLNIDRMSADSREKFLAVAQLAERNGSDTAFQVIHLPAQNDSHGKGDHLIGIRCVGVSETGHGYLQISSMDLVLPEESMNAFRAAFGLTGAEVNILGALISGQRQTEIAASLGIREDTVKKHIRQIREKTNTANTTALVCLAASFAQVPLERDESVSRKQKKAVSVTNKSNQTYVMPTQHKQVLVNNIRVEYAEFGSKFGKPLVIMHSSMVGFILPPDFINSLVLSGFRVILPFRPGNGVSGMLRGRFSRDATARHLLDFLHALKIDRFCLLAGTVGFHYAANIAALAPEEVEAIVGVAGYVPVDPEVIRRHMARYQRGVLYTLQHNRSLAKFLVLSGYRMFLQMGPQHFLNQIMKNSKADLSVLDDSGSLGLLSIGLKIAAAQGVDTMLNDSSLILSDWSDLIRDLHCPVHLLHGDDDSIYPYDVVEEFCREHPGFGLTKVEKTGQLMIFQKPKRIAELVAEKLDDLQGKSG